MKKIAIIVLVLVVIGGAWYAMKGSSGQQVLPGDSIDLVTQFYGQWLTAAQDQNAKPSKATLAASPLLSPALRDKLTTAVKNNTTPDPVLCQASAPAGITTRTLSEAADKAQIIIAPKGSAVTQIALASLTKLATGWYIDDISCSNGDVAPAAPQFSFEKQGFLLQKSVPKPYNSKNWHLVYEDNGKEGNVVPLIFDKNSQCVATDGTTSTCNPAKFTEATQVSVHAQMTEAGAQVVRMEFVK